MCKRINSDSSLDQVLEYIENFKGDFHNLIEEIAPRFQSYGKCKYSYNNWYISTGGWSDNERIIQALQKNRLFWITCWYSSERGGHYVFKIES